MHPNATPIFLDAIRRSHTAYSRVEAWYGGSLVEGAEDIYFDEGEVSVTSGTGVRRTISLGIPEAKYWDLLSPIGTELKAYRGVKFNSQIIEIPLGVFPIDVYSQSVKSTGKGMTISSAPDRWMKIQRARFPIPVKANSTMPMTEQMLYFVQLVFPGLANHITATSRDIVGVQTWERDRAGAINEMAENIGAEAYFNNDGEFVIKNIPKLSATPVWFVDSRDGGILITGDRTRDPSRTYNVVVVFPSYTDGSTPFTTQIVKDTDTTSPTYVLGPMGEVPYFFPSAVLRTNTAARLAGESLLRKVRSDNAKMAVECMVNPALQEGDVMAIYIGNGIEERHMADSFNIPLIASEATHRISTRSTRPFGDVPESE